MELTRISQRNLGRDNRMVGNEPPRIKQCCRSGSESNILAESGSGSKNVKFFDAQAIEEAFSPQKRPSSTSKYEISLFFSIFVGHFCLLDPDPDPATQIDAAPCGIRIRNPACHLRVLAQLRVQLLQIELSEKNSFRPETWSYFRCCESSTLQAFCNGPFLFVIEQNRIEQRLFLLNQMTIQR